MDLLRFRRVTCALALLVLVGAAGRTASAQTLAEEFDGTLQIAWGDPHPESGARGTVRYSLATADGRVYQLTSAEAAGLGASDFGKRVVISGRRTAPGGIIGNARASETIVVDAVANRPGSQAAIGGESVTGTRKVIFLLVKFADDAAVPHAPTFYTDLTNPLTPPAGQPFPTTINGFYAKTSWNQFLWQGFVGGVGGLGAPGGWLTLPQPKSYYAPCGWSTSCANLNALSADAIALGKAQGISFAAYDNINFVLSNDLDCCAWGGTYSVDGKSFGATWEPPWGQETGVYSHEMGHSLGLPHSGWTYYAYDSPWDMMSARTSASSTLCGSYSSRNDAGGTRNLSCTEPGNGYIAVHKDVLGWIPPANIATINSTASGTFTLDGVALALGSPLKLLKICLPGFACTGSSARFLTVEARVKALGGVSQFDNAIPREGILIQDVQMGRPRITGSCYFNNQSGWAVPIDSTPGDYNSTNCTYTPGTALYNANFSPGQTYSNAGYDLNLTVVSRTGSSFVVAVNSSGTAPGAFSKTSPVAGATAQPLSLTLSWSAAADASSYEYCYDTTNDSACSSWISTGTATSATISGLTGGATYYWHARAVNGIGTTYADGSASAFRSFTTVLVPGAFNKTAPAQAATGLPTSTTLSWGASANASSYHYCIDTTNDNACSTWTSTSTATSVVVPLTAGTTYYWHVRAFNAQGTTYANGSTTAFWSFSTAAPAPGAFGKSAPANGASVQPTTPTLTWAASSGAARYEYCYDTTSNGSCDGTWTSVGTATSAALSGLSAATTYSWQVRAVNATGTTNANSGTWWSFTTGVPVTVSTNPSGRTVIVDGSTYVAPQSFTWAAGSSHSLSTVTPQSSSNTRYVFTSWSDAGAITHNVTASTPRTYTANFVRTHFKLTTTITSSGGNVTASPVSADGFYADGTIVELTQTPNVGYRFSGWGGDLAGVEPEESVTLDAPRAVTAGFSSELVQNGQFNSDVDVDWTPFATPDDSYVQLQAISSMMSPSSGIMFVHRLTPPEGVATEAGLFQRTGVPLPALAPLRAQVKIGNSSAVRQRINVRLADADLSDVSACAFWLEPNAAPQTYQVRGHTTTAWSNTTVYIVADTPDSEEAFYTVDAVSLKYEPTGSTAITECVDPTVPAPLLAGADSPSLIVNGSFSAGSSSWTTTGPIESRLSSGVFEFYRSTAEAAGALRQESGRRVEAAQLFTAQWQMGNSSAIRQQVTVRAGDRDGRDGAACTFWIPPGQALAAYTMRGFSSRVWASATLSIDLQTAGDDKWLQLDNVALALTPTTPTVGTTCAAPAAAPVSSGAAPIWTSGPTLEPPSVQRWPLDGLAAIGRAR